MSISRRILINDVLRAIAFGATVLAGGLGVRSASSRTQRASDADGKPRSPGWTLRVRDDLGRERVLSARCPHLGCRVERDSDGKALTCPCHGSRFDLQGRRMAGPANRDLEAAG